ncbi:hypothetical protein GQX73_g1985 [Xylaria multiplex]|uniref:CorA-like transporter domain-containing protein n=1 Tax=Xylaria multiplex TaxID=323545 RepID=A0A7C8MVM6_9PEZI|nr:hypothetical protein GQX73_g1985 [Xylaria multiplex]
MINAFDQLLDACADSKSYPAKLLRSDLFPSALRRYNELIDERESRVFSDDSDSEYFNIRFWDCFDGQQDFPPRPHTCNSVGQLNEYLLVNRKDPKCRHIFIRADHSRAPLDCSREMLSLVFTFHQVMAQFLDVVLFFGTFPGLNVPTAFQHCVFRHERFVAPDDASRFKIPQLGRSGMEIKHCYNLWSAEKSDSSHGKRAPWEIRQAGLYHSLDLLNGKATWIHIKANEILEKRIDEAYNSIKLHQGHNPQTVLGSLSATLLTHLILFEWCGENWRQYLNYWECELGRILTTIRNAPISKVEKLLVDVKSDILGSPTQQLPIPPAARMGTLSSQTTRWGLTGSPTFMSKSSTLLFSSFAEKHIKSDHNRFSQVAVSESNAQTPAPIQASVDDAGPGQDPFHIFEEFKLEDLQHLHHIGSKLHEADMVLKLNADVLLEVMEYFKNFANDLQTPKELRDGCQASLSRFLQRTMGIVRELEAERMRISTLIALLNDGKTLFDAITQFRNIELNQLSSARMEMMTKDMHQSTLQMENIAGRTEKETSSMHIITLVTLLFLPGTFVATFLGAGFYQWPDADDTSQIPDFPIWRNGYFSLFAMISFPLMALTLLFWAWPYLLRWISRQQPCGLIQRIRGARKHKNLDEEAQIASDGACGSARLRAT